nr:YmfL family putative regulatory protein [uncultured Kingella sp.]
MSGVINQSLRQMAKSPNGGHATTAAMLGMTAAALENRLYEIKGQQISIEQAMLLQRMTERTDFAQAVAQESGGVFVRLPEIDAAAMQGEDITACFLNAVEKLGVLSAQWRAATDDGRVNSRESGELLHTARETAKFVLAVSVLTDHIFRE